MPDPKSKIIAYLSSLFDEDFHSYTNTIIEQRLEERTKQLALTSIDNYLKLLLNNAGEAAHFARMLRIRYSKFFRNPLQFQILRELLLPQMLAKNTQGLFKVWSAACAAGEEPYSLAIILCEIADSLEDCPQMQIFATDVANDALDEAHIGMYPSERLENVTLGRFERFFNAEGNRYRLKESLRTKVFFSHYDLLNRKTFAPPESVFGGFDLVLCRNFLMYLEPSAYNRVFDNLFKSLNPDGVLMLGKTESIPKNYASKFEKLYDFGCIYKKNIQ